VSIEKTLSESAFLVNQSRALNVEMGRDIYAGLWVTDETRELWNSFSREVYPYDHIELAARNRFFLEALEQFIDRHNHPLFINIGAGFTSYPFLLPPDVESIEIDLPPVIEFKTERIRNWQQYGYLPKRNILFHGIDIRGTKGYRSLKRFLGDIEKKADTFVLMEGLSYYLAHDEFMGIVSAVKSIQLQGDFLAFDFWTPENLKNPVFKRFREFFKTRFTYNNMQYNLMKEKQVSEIDGYRTVIISNVQAVEKRFSSNPMLTKWEEILPEQYAILERSATH
jgi:O-methyltransferase involved in polyketide biosynthesis